MGVIYSVACKDCKITRDLDKFYEAREVDDRKDALKFADELKDKSFRAALLVSFMVTHTGHDCVFFKEQSECEQDYDPMYEENEYTEDTDYWG